MSGKTNKPDRDDRRDDKAARLAEALRANLHRRKQQARAREATEPDPTPDPGPTSQPGATPDPKDKA